MSLYKRRVHITEMMSRAEEATGCAVGMGTRYAATLRRAGAVVAEQLDAGALYRMSRAGDEAEVTVYRRGAGCWRAALVVAFVVMGSERPVVRQLVATAGDLRAEMLRLAHEVRSAAGVVRGNAEFVGAIAQDVGRPGRAGRSEDRAEARRALMQAAGDTGRAAGDLTGIADRLVGVAGDVVPMDGNLTEENLSQTGRDHD